MAPRGCGFSRACSSCSEEHSRILLPVLIILIVERCFLLNWGRYMTGIWNHFVFATLAPMALGKILGFE